MEDMISWLQDNLGKDFEIVTPQFERIEKLEFKYLPANKKEFMAVIEKAPWDILFGMGFRKWESMNNLIKENNAMKPKERIKIPIINAPSKTYDVDIGKNEDTPQELLEEDEMILMIPGEWYRIIPEGFMVTGLYGEQYPFVEGESDDDIRFGCLPYGIRRVV